MEIPGGELPDLASCREIKHLRAKLVAYAFCLKIDCM